MSENEDQSIELRQARLERQSQVAFRDSILRLIENADFRTVIENHFMTEETLRAARSIADPNLDAKMQSDMVSMAAASGHLRRYLSAHIQMGNQAEREIEQINEQLEEIGLYGEDE